MKKIILIMLFILFYKTGYSQVTFVPDENFEQALIDLGHDILLNGFVQTANINTITSLDVSNKNISNLTGIQGFVALQELYVNNNSLANIDLTQNTALWYLDARFNQLTDLDLSQNTLLRTLSVNDNQLTFLNLNPNNVLEIVDCANNHLGALSIKNGNNAALIFLDTTGNAGLTCIQVEDVAYANSHWTSIDPQTSFNTDCSAEINTYVPDDNFEQALIDLGYDTGALDDYVPKANINTIINLDVSLKNIDNLTGIKDFTALQELNCAVNNLTSLNVSHNTQLEVFYCSGNQLTSLDVSQNTALENLQCHANQLTSLDVSQNTMLTFLNVGSNELTSLNVKNGNNTALTTFVATINPNLTCIDVDDASYSATNWTSIDAQTGFSEDCNGPQTYIPDNNFEQALLDLGYDTGTLDNYVFTANITTITSLDLQNKAIDDLTGIQDFIALQYLFVNGNNLTSLDITQNTALLNLICATNQLSSLDISNNTLLQVLNCSENLIISLNLSNNTALETLICNTNQITSLDVSNNLSLELLHCYSNQLTSLNLSNNAALVTLSCVTNQLTSLDVSNNISLEALYCYSNQLTSLNVKNGNNTNFTNFRAYNNVNLTCIEVDDVAYSTTNWTEIDVQSSFSENCHYNETYVPDDNFEQALIDLGYDTGALDDYVPTDNINTITSLDVSGKNISDLSGIEDFSALQVLNCPDNQLTNLDVSQNTALTTLSCGLNDIISLDISQNTVLTTLDVLLNNLTTLDVSQNTILEVLSCGANQLTNLDVSQNTALKSLYINSNELTDLNLSQNTALETLNCNSNQLTSLDVSQNITLVELLCDLNGITNLDVSQNAVIEVLHCGGNQLTSLNVKNAANTIISSFSAINNINLTCIDVDNPSYSTTNWTNIDAQTSFSVDCTTPQTYVPDDNFEQALIDLGYDTGVLNDYVPTANISTVTSLSLLSENIVDLTGIEDFTALTILVCAQNQLISLDVSQNTALTLLNCASNQLSNLDISQNTLLESLQCAGNQLTNLDVTFNTQLTYLVCSTNQLTSLDISQNTALTELHAASNGFTNLDVSLNTALYTLNCSSNQLTNLDLSVNTSLSELICYSNQLTSLNVKNANNTNITTFQAASNPNLTCIDVDDASYSTTNWTDIDVQTNFSENCGDSTTCGNAQTIVVSETANTINFDLTGETISNETSCSGVVDSYADTWFEFTMPEDGSIGINGQVDVNLFALYDTCGGAEIACFNNTEIVEGLTNGATYKLRVFRTAATASNSNSTSFDIILGSALSLEDVSVTEDTIKIFPNPASSFLTIESSVAIEKIVFYNFQGKMVFKSLNTNNIPVNQLPNGLYLLKIYSEKNVFTKKFMKK